MNEDPNSPIDPAEELAHIRNTRGLSKLVGFTERQFQHIDSWLDEQVSYRKIAEWCRTEWQREVPHMTIARYAKRRTALVLAADLDESKEAAAEISRYAATGDASFSTNTLELLEQKRPSTSLPFTNATATPPTLKPSNNSPPSSTRRGTPKSANATPPFRNKNSNSAAKNSPSNANSSTPAWLALLILISPTIRATTLLQPKRQLPSKTMGGARSTRAPLLIRATRWVQPTPPQQTKTPPREKLSLRPLRPLPQSQKLKPLLPSIDSPPLIPCPTTST